MRLALALLAGCTTPRTVLDTLSRSEAALAKAEAAHARACAPVELAHARADLDFARLELIQGHVARAGEHAEASLASATAARDLAIPCGGADRDGDGIPDIVDRCPDEREDFDGFQDDDGCRDIDPRGDEDGDGILNIDDACVDEPEDLDGDADDDGCPETSEDRDGDGMIDAVDRCPEAAEDFDGFQDDDGCPDPDNDEDGVPDPRDRCPNAAEDLDGWDDEDGCPDPDNDEDGIPDADDRCPNEPGDPALQGCPTLDADGDGVADDRDQCPNEPETMNGYLDDDGCPDTPPTQVVVTRTRVEIREMLQFETGSARLLDASFPILDQIVKVLGDAPGMRLRIEGHTDAQGADDANMELSRERAISVRAYLEGKGIQGSRLEAIGKGEEFPIDTNRTPEGRAKNRRVEFHILER